MTESFCAFRGTTKLTENMFRAHLASILRLENIGVLLGAGASVGAGGKTMAELWEHFKTQSANEEKWLRAEGYFGNKSNSEDTEVSCHSSGPPNVEALLDTLAISISEWKRVKDNKLAEGLKARAAIYRAVIAASKLNNAWWKTVSGPDLSESKLSDHRKMLQRFSSARQPGQSSPWIFTTNYDLAIEWAADSIDLNIINGFLGVHSRKFSPQSFDLGYRNVQARGEAQFGTYNVYLAKLHGSLTWKEANDGQFYELQASEGWRGIQEFLSNPNSDLPFTVMPSAAKYVQTVGFVLGELLRRFAEFLSRPQAALIVSGYGFGDEHINRLLHSAFLNPTFQLVVYIPKFIGKENLNDLPIAIKKLVELENPRVTIVGGAYFDAFADHLPDPAIYNEDLKALEDRLNSTNKEQ